jgi:hypothetical protein
VAPDRLVHLARWIVRHSAHFGVDPTLVSALIYHQSRCREHHRSSYGLGLAQINLGMHNRHLRRGRYRFWVQKNGRWRFRSQQMDRFPFTRRLLLQDEPNIYFAAGILSVLEKQCPALDGTFGSVPHRHPVSHFIWGDRVRDAGAEDQILRARRRLIGYLGGGRPRALGRHLTLPLGSPLDGPPLKVTSGFGDDREGGRRRHTGIDLASYFGEPVRAVAPGRVTLAGVDLGRARLRSLAPDRVGVVRPSQLGPRGLLVTILHPGGLVSEYMHLSAYVVHKGQEVKRGQLLGYVGRSGIKESDAHLHFGLRHDGHALDPVPLLQPHVFPADATYVGRRKIAAQVLRRRQRARGTRGRKPWEPLSGCQRKKAGSRHSSPGSQ